MFYKERSWLVSIHIMMTQSLRNILLVSLLCDVIKGNIILRNNNDEYENETSKNSTISLDDLKFYSKIWDIVVIYIFFVCFLISLQISFQWLCNFLTCSMIYSGCYKMVHICINYLFRFHNSVAFIRAILRNFWSPYNYLENHEAPIEPTVLYNSEQGITFNI